MRAALINETKVASATHYSLITTHSLLVATPAYLDERDAAELQLHQRIAELELKGRNP